jgi:hypothetical protein
MTTTTRGHAAFKRHEDAPLNGLSHLFLYADRQPQDAPFVDKMSVLALKNAKFTWLPA